MWQRPLASIQITLLDEEQDVQITRKPNFDFRVGRPLSRAVSSARIVTWQALYGSTFVVCSPHFLWSLNLL